MTTPAAGIQSELALEHLWGELKDHVFPGVEGFLAKYFEGQDWSSAVQDILNHPESADVVGKLSTDLFDLTDSDDLARWLLTFQSLFSAARHPYPHLRSRSLNAVDSSLGTSIHFTTSANLHTITGNTRVYGEYHRTTKPTVGSSGDFHDHNKFLRFTARALQVFNTQPTRYFLHAFLLCGTNLELWIFDRSGAYGSKKLDIGQNPQILLLVLAGYGMMSSEESGINTFIKSGGPPSYGDCVTFSQDTTFNLRPDLIAVPDYLVGPGTTCFTASARPSTEPDVVIKFSWRDDPTHAELQLLKKTRERNVWGVTQLLYHQDLISIADHRRELLFPRQYVNRTLSCIVAYPFGRPIQKFKSIRELLEALGDLVGALQSLYIDGRMLHRDVAIKNLVINPYASTDSSKGILIDFDQALELDTARAVEPLVGSDGFMAIGILSGTSHTYRHDLESLFYVFLWLAIGNDTEHDHAHAILETLPKTSRLWKWCSMDFRAVGVTKAADMSPEGFEGILDEFSATFTMLRDLAKELHGLLFPWRNGAIFTGTDTDPAAVQYLYSGMANAFHRWALKLPR